MLAFSLVLIFAESLAELIMSPALRAASAVIALMGVTALIIYRQSLLAKFRNPNRVNNYDFMHNDLSYSFISVCGTAQMAIRMDT